MFAGFTETRVATQDGTVFLQRAGSGPAVLLLHGFPETHHAWHLVAPVLAERFAVVVADLPGYGESTVGTDVNESLSKRRMARMLADALRSIGLESWSVAGHDRGGRVAYRMALDTPALVERLAVLDIVPTLDMASHCSYELATNLVNWFLLAQPAPFPEQLIAASGDLYINTILDSWLGPDGALDPVARAAYVRAFQNPNVVHTICEEYRAGSTDDIAHDRADRDAGRTISCPVLALWSAEDLTARFFDPLSTWRKWATDVRGREVPAGHFLMEEAPEIVIRELTSFLNSRDVA